MREASTVISGVVNTIIGGDKKVRRTSLNTNDFLDGWSSSGVDKAIKCNAVISTKPKLIVGRDGPNTVDATNGRNIFIFECCRRCKRNGIIKRETKARLSAYDYGIIVRID